jgi:kynurenine 3-monooxygenase
MSSQRITLIGGGLAGPLLAMYLARRSFTVDMYERRADMRNGSAAEGRSINLALSTRGIYALKEIGLDRDILNIAIPMRGRMIHAVDGDLRFQPYGKDETEVIYSVSRSRLNIALLDAAEATGNVSMRFHTRCTGMEFHTNDIFLRNELTGEESAVRTTPVIGTDGSASALRLSMRAQQGFIDRQDVLEYGYKELTIPASANGDFQMEPNALHIWPRKTFMLIALPNIDRTFTCILFYPFKGEESFEHLTTEDEVGRFFRAYFPDALRLMPSAVENFFSNPTGAMVTVRCSPWHVGGKALLLGDAAHAIVPFFGQGMNCAFEDCTELNGCLDRYGADWERVFEEFERLRKPNADAIATLALENFVEMRDLVADPRFLLRKSVELELERRLPGVFISKYGMVTFHRIPYSIAQERGRIQDRLLSELCEGIDRVEDVDWEKAETMIRREVAEISV